MRKRESMQGELIFILLTVLTLASWHGHVMPKHKCGMIGHQMFEVWQTVMATFMPKVQHMPVSNWWKNWTQKTSSEKFRYAHAF